MMLNVSYSNRSKTVEGSKSLFRIRVGDYRILYEVDYRNNLRRILN